MAAQGERRLLLATGATAPRVLPVEGCDLPGVHFAMEYLTESIKTHLDGRAPALSAEVRDVIVIGGGDAGDGLHRHRAAPVLPEPDQLRSVPQIAAATRPA